MSLASEVLVDLRRSLRQTDALLARLRRSGDLQIGPSDAEQLARYRTAHPEEFEFEGLCRRLVQDLKIARQRAGNRP